MRQALRCGTLGVLSLLCVGCSGLFRPNLVTSTGGNAALFQQFQAFDGRTGNPISFAEVVRRSRRADVVFLGEEHSNSVCNQLEAQLFHALSCDRRPTALALEFFEADTQASVDAYLRGRIAEDAFRKQTRQRGAYLLAHRPLVEWCRRAAIPVIAANAPRRLVREYRLSAQDFKEFRAGLDPEEQRWLPRASEYIAGAYRGRFLETMRDTHPPTTTRPASSSTSQPASQPTTTEPAASMPASRPTASMPASRPVASTPTSRPGASLPASQPAGMPSLASPERLYLAMLLWDNAMAESLADFRRMHPAHRVFLIVGSFHVEEQGGTLAQFRQRRPNDHTCTIVFRATPDGDFTFNPDDYGAGDVVMYGITPPEAAPTMPPSPPEPPAPTTQPTTTLGSE